MDLREPLSVYYQKSLDHARQGQFDAAYENRSCTIQLAPNFAEFYFYPGQYSWQLDCLEGALTNLNKPIGLKSDEAPFIPLEQEHYRD